MLADMHTHSEYSHDSNCKIEEMCAAQLKKGTEIFAVTDHFDTASYTTYDVFTPIQNACKAVAALRKQYKSHPLILSGIEISEGFWHPEVGQKAISMADYDVVIGSVHLVRYPGLLSAYSRIDFSALDREVVLQYLDAYFDDVLTLLQTTDFDILAHLTCPLRYITGKYNIKVDLLRYEKKIEAILNKVLSRGIALEVNTSSFDLLGEWMPSTRILKKYYEMGGSFITLGSDAHLPKHASAHFEQAVQGLKTIGFLNVYYYQNRKPCPISIGRNTQFIINSQR